MAVACKTGQQHFGDGTCTGWNTFQYAVPEKEHRPDPEIAGRKDVSTQFHNGYLYQDQSRCWRTSRPNHSLQPSPITCSTRSITAPAISGHEWRRNGKQRYQALELTLTIYRLLWQLHDLGMPKWSSLAISVKKQILPNSLFSINFPIKDQPSQTRYGTRDSQTIIYLVDVPKAAQTAIPHRRPTNLLYDLPVNITRQTWWTIHWA